MPQPFRAIRKLNIPTVASGGLTIVNIVDQHEFGEYQIANLSSVDTVYRDNGGGSFSYQILPGDTLKFQMHGKKDIVVAKANNAGQVDVQYIVTSLAVKIPSFTMEAP